MKLYFDEPDLDAQLQRTVAKAMYRCADLGEALAAARRIDPASYRSWYEVWRDLAREVEGFADGFAAAGSRRNALEAYLRAGEYHRQSYFFRRRDTADPALLDAFAATRRTFSEATKFMDAPCERVAIPYRDETGETTLPGYLARPDDGGAARPTLIYPCGYDSPMEEGFGPGAVEATARGWNCLLFAGPGQAEVLYEQGRTFRHDFEAVLTPAVDFLVGRDDVDRDRIAIMGRSFAGYLAPRGATGEHRLAALVADPGQIDMGANLRAMIPEPWHAMIEAGDRAGLDAAAAKAFAGERGAEFLGSRFAAHGVDNFLDYARELESWKVAPEHIRCPAFLSQGEGDFAGQNAQRLHDAISVESKVFHQFTEAEGSGGHCEGLGVTRFNHRAWDWLQSTVGNGR